MKKNYDPRLIETFWYEKWESSGYFNANPKSESEPFCIMIPPPNVTGTLHMGHGYQNTLMDALIRFKRMSGFDTLWQVGTDHAGIATQMVVERQLEAEGSNKEDIGREKFERRVWDWKEASGTKITQQLRRLGASVDWSRETFTMNADMSNAVKEVFIILYNKDLIYRGKRLVNWDVTLQTALSDLEVITAEEEGQLWFFSYPVISGDEIMIATTRPETMFGDAAVAVNPNDKRYKNLIGKKVLLPISEREIPIIPDNHVDPEFGTGCVKVTPAHDFNDFEIASRHQLPLINILNLDGTLNHETPKEFIGLDRFEARKQVIKKMSSLGLHKKTLRRTLNIRRGDRSNAILEPLLTNQWYVNAKELSKQAIKAVEDGETQFVPKNWEKTYFSWMKNIEDWCISRQLWWGHRIPAWFDSEENIYVGKDEKEIRKNNNIPKDKILKQDEDVLDTWFSSALWTFSSLGWPKNKRLLSRYHPTDILVTGFDIIFFWVARMIMMTKHFMNEVPFKKIFIHGLIRDSEGQKMSKSKGNILDPLDIIDGINLNSLVLKRTEGLMQPKMEKRIQQQTKKEFPNGIPAFGTDSLRLSFCSLASGNRDINFDMKRVEGYRNFCNKLWNAARFIDIQLQEYPKIPSNESMDIVDKWIRNKFDNAIERVNLGFKDFRFDLVTQAIYEFIWYEFCDWYLEIVKIKLSTDSLKKEEKAAVLKSMVNIFERSLRLAHPLIPFITEEIWQQMKPIHSKKSLSIMISKYPQSLGRKYKKEENAVEWLKSVVSGIRNIRGELKVKPSLKIKGIVKGGNQEDIKRIKNFSDLIVKLSGLEELIWLEKDEPQPASAISLHGNLQVLIPLKGLIDPQSEKERLEKKINKLDIENSSIKNQLKNAKFIKNAPKDLIKGQRARLKVMSGEKAGLTLQLKEIKKLT